MAKSKTYSFTDEQIENICNLLFERITKEPVQHLRKKFFYSTMNKIMPLISQLDKDVGIMLTTYVSYKDAAFKEESAQMEQDAKENILESF